MLYLDYCATTPMSEEALTTYLQTAQRYYGNEQSLHDPGHEAKQLYEYCKQELADLINGEADGIYFTSGGSDSNFRALYGLAHGYKRKGDQIITSPLEHPSVYQSLEKLKAEGFTVKEVGLKKNGQVCLESLKRLISSRTILVTICHASSETGVIQPLEEIGRIVKEKNIIFHSDAVQSFGKIPLDIQKYGLSSVSVSAHKLYGPKNTGFCYISPQSTWAAVTPGAVHQNGFSAGTLDIPGIASFTTASKSIHEQLIENTDKYQKMRRWLLEQLDKEIFSLLGDQINRLPHHLGLRAKGHEGQWIMLECSRNGIAVSSGSACKSYSSSPPKSLLAMGHSPEEAHGLFRISFGKDTSYQHLEKTAEVLNSIVKTSRTPSV
ncbi:IscS subfamily cysteine desulfurase [Alteribacillus sp. HJP-4]|uniref:IscS subfamily cysteine desulfurase n=1 Tax=Alteribacillus sp. HJP-4 TaxID=2775394 RepID=UPI0035CCC9AA